MISVGLLPSAASQKITNIRVWEGGAEAWAHPNFCLVGHNALGPTNNLPVSSLIIRKISKICVTRCHILKPKCIKFAFRWGSASDPAGGAYSALPDPLGRQHCVIP